MNLAFKVTGRIKELLVDEGAAVIEGQKLAALDKVYFEDSLAQARAQREQSAAVLTKMEAGNRPEEIAQAEALVAEREATLANAKVTLDRADKLLKTSVGTQKTYDDAFAIYRQAEAQLKSSRQALHLMKIGFRKEDIDLARAQLAEKDAAVQVAERQLADADLIAPSAGIVLSRVREVGAIVNAGDTVFVGLAQCGLMTFIVTRVFGIPLSGSAIIMFIGLTVFLIAMIGVGLFISSLVSSQQQAMMGIMVCMMPVMMLSGFTSPVQNMPDWLQWVALANPLTHILVIVRGVFLRDMPVRLIVERIWPMAAVAVVTISAASWMFRRKVQ